MPTAVAAGIASTALSAPVVAGGLGALGTGLVAGSTLAGGAGIFSNFMAGAAPGLTGTLGGAAMTPTIASLAPAATAQAMGPSMLQSAGLDALKSQAIGGGVQQAAAQQASNLAFQQAAAQNMAGGLASPMSQMGAKFLTQSQAAGMPIANASNINFLNSATAGGNVMPAETLGSQVATTSPYDLSAGFRQGLDPRVLQQPSLSNPTVSPLNTTQAANPADIVGRSIRPNQNFVQNLGNISSFQDVKDYASEHPYATSAMAGLGAMGLAKMMEQKKVPKPEDKAMIRPYTYERTQRPEAYATSPGMDSSERLYFNDQFIAGEPYKAAEGGIAAAYAIGGQVEQMAAMNAVGQNTGYPMANLQTPMYSNPAIQRPEATNIIAPSVDAGVNAYSGEPRFAQGGGTKTEGEYKYSYDPQTMQFTQATAPVTRTIVRNIMTAPTGEYTAGPVTNTGAKISGGITTPAMGPMQPQQATRINVPAYQSPEQQLGLGGFYDYMNQQLAGYGGYAAGGNVGGGISHLGDYSDGGRLLKGPGDGVSDSIPAVIGKRQPARLADGEFVVPARIVSELGNGSTEAGARKLYAMMERVQASRKKSIGKKKVAVNSKADNHLPA
jgi:hypothetical protein